MTPSNLVPLTCSQADIAVEKGSNINMPLIENNNEKKEFQHRLTL